MAEVVNPQRYVKTVGNVVMPRMLYGTAWTKERTAEFVFQAVQAGFRGIDTACQPKHYSEDLVGQALAKLSVQLGIKRNELFLQTKFTSVDGQDPLRIPYDSKAALPDQVRQSFARSLKNLQTDYIDSLVLHSPLRQHSDTMVVWRVFEELADSKKVRQLGISNIYDLPSLTKIWNEARIKPAVVQNRFYRQTQYDRELRAFCKTNGIIYQSFWTLTGNPDILKSQPVRQLASDLKCSPEQVWYKYVTQLGIVPLNGTTSLGHMREDLAVLDWANLSDADMQSIGAQIGEAAAATAEL